MKKQIVIRKLENRWCIEHDEDEDARATDWAEIFLPFLIQQSWEVKNLLLW